MLSLNDMSMNCKLNSYLIFDGDCTEAFELYARAFRGTPRYLRMGDMPDAPAECRHLVVHVNLNIGDTMLMGSDSVPGYSPTLIKGNNQSVVIHPESREDADRFFAILSEGGVVEQPMADMFFGYYATFTDRYGICWMIVVLPEEHCGA